MNQEPKFKIGDCVELVGIYRSDKPNHYKGKIIEHFLDPSAPSIGGSINVYVVEGIGTYGEGALKGCVTWKKLIKKLFKIV